MAAEQIGFLNFTRLVIDALEAVKITYLVGGALAVWAWGQPRTTQDLDLVIHLPFESIYPLSRELEQRRMLVPPDILLDLLLQTQGDLPVNAIHLDTNYKAEFFLLREGDTFRATTLQRRRLADYGPPLGTIYVHSPEDLILNKVAYYALSRQTKHVRDIGSILISDEGERLNWEHINTWVSHLHLEAAWAELLDKVDDLWRRST
jgi:hypothetical protein